MWRNEKKKSKQKHGRKELKREGKTNYGLVRKEKGKEVTYSVHLFDCI